MAPVVTMDRLVVARGAAAGLLLAAPATLANGILAGQDDRSAALSLLTLVLVVVGFGVAGFSAGHERPDLARPHGLAAAMLTLIPVEILAVLGRLDRGAGISLVLIVVTGFFAAGAGSAGSLIGAKRATGRSAT